MAEGVCEKLISERPWKKYTDTKNIPHTEGIHKKTSIRDWRITNMVVKKLTSMLGTILKTIAKKIYVLSGLKSPNPRRRKPLTSTAWSKSWIISWNTTKQVEARNMVNNKCVRESFGEFFFIIFCKLRSCSVIRCQNTYT